MKEEHIQAQHFILTRGRQASRSPFHIDARWVSPFQTPLHLVCASASQNLMRRLVRLPFVLGTTGGLYGKLVSSVWTIHGIGVIEMAMTISKRAA